MNLRHSRVARTAFALIAVAACLFLMQAAAKIGFSRLLTRYAMAANSLAAADQAIQLTPDDPDAHRARALVLTRLQRTTEAERSLEIATSLRGGHAAQWLELGTAREESGDDEGALAAFNQAITTEAFYAIRRDALMTITAPQGNPNAPNATPANYDAATITALNAATKDKNSLVRAQAINSLGFLRVIQ